MSIDWLGPRIAALVQELLSPQGGWTLGVLAACLAVAWALARLARRRLHADWPRARGGALVHDWVRRVIPPVLAWLLLSLAHAVLSEVLPVGILALGMALALSLAVIRASLLMLRQTFHNPAWMASVERTVSALIWSMVALHILDLLPTLLDALDAWVIPLGKAKLTVLQLLTGLVTVLASSVLALWLSRALDARLRDAPGLHPGARAVLARLAQPVLLVLMLLIVLPLVGFDLTTLSVFGGALGVGLGLGMQKIAANYVAGFIILLDESIEPGRLIRVDRYRGVVSEICTRYTVLRGADGVDAIVPNEMLVSAVVESETFGSTLTRVAVQVGISYDSDVERAMALIVEVAQAQSRVLKDPAPAAFLVAFGDSAITLELGVWIDDPQAGTLSLRSEINLGILRALRAAGIEIPVPQREFTLKGALPSA